MTKNCGFLAATLASLAMVMAPQLALARTVPGCSGVPTVYGTAATSWSCWGIESVNGLNTCSSAMLVFYSLPVDNTGAKTATVTVYSATATPVQCAAQADNAQATSYSWSGWISAPTAPGQTQFNLTGASVPSGGTLYVKCYLPTEG